MGLTAIFTYHLSNVMTAEKNIYCTTECLLVNLLVLLLVILIFRFFLLYT